VLPDARLFVLPDARLFALPDARLFALPDARLFALPDAHRSHCRTRTVALPDYLLGLGLIVE
jgi:hypothetical protein